MTERWSEMEGRLKPSRGLEERFRDHPELQAKIESLLAVVENAAGDVEKAAEAERRVTEELRQLGNEALHGWARRQAQRKEEEVAQQPGVQRKEKKRLLADPVRTDRSSGAGLPARDARAGDPAIHAFGGGGLPGLLGAAAASDR
ncbi:MAG: hypothetical protein V5B34_08190 [Accumulibacter sp.]|jgi:ATP/maltotriose-dependent transcriptional regulator MalT|uniref:hypothetical protein n=1 Tax=Accumulibacter sp. TaxID=2053492 RepID=UPI002FC393BA